MRKSNVFTVFTLAAAVLASVGCDNDKTSNVEISADTLIIDGSSTVYPISKEAAERFLRRNKNASISVKFSGSGAGFQLFCSGQSDINDASRPMNDKEKALCAQNGIAYTALPLAVDTIAVVTHLKNDWANDLSVAELKTIWQKAAEGNVTNWNQVRSGFPDKPLALYGRGQASGTYDYFTDKINGEAGVSRSDYTASENEEELVEKIANDPNALAFFGIGAYHRHWQELKLLAIDNGNGAVAPSLQTAADGSYQPLTRKLYLYVNNASLEDKQDLKPFLQHYYGNLRTWLHFTGYMPLHNSDYQAVLEQLQ
ncbi:PstS family phosphate ABC transporter substrate-binding protein [Pasteurella testudinis]|uniref:PstS family phosphate ABC transporter substrate-binding protein n=1 Tax=Pasteurella testudinis TaxID=761 RepID=UPI004058ED2A